MTTVPAAPESSSLDPPMPSPSGRALTWRRRLPSAAHAAAIAIAFSFVALAGAYNRSVPSFEGADESTHYFYAKHIRCTGTLPVQQADAEKRGLWEQEGSQPPLYYWLASTLVFPEWTHNEPYLDIRPSAYCKPAWDHLTFNDQNSMGRPSVRGNENRFVQDGGTASRGYAAAIRLVRGLSTLLGMFTLVALWSIFAHLFTRRPWLAVAALALVALNPQFIHLSSTVSNDNAMNALAAMSIALLIRVVDIDGNAARTRFARRRDATALALAVGLAPLAKITGLALAAFVVATLLWTAWRRRDAGAPHARIDARHLAATATAVALACLVLAGWWYVRNIRLYGSLTGLNIMLPPELRRDVNLARFIRGLPAELYGLWLSSWGIFGWFTILLPTWVYRLIDAAALAAMAGGVLSWRRRDRRPITPAPALGEGSARIARRGLGAAATLYLLIVWWLLTFAALLRWMLIAKGAHGRLLFPAIAAPAVLLVLGWRALVPAKRVGDRTLAAVVAVAMACLSVGALVGAIRPAYAMPRSISPDALPSDAVPIGVVFDGVFELAAMRAPARVVEGSDVDVTLYWRIGDHKMGGMSGFEDRTRDGYVALRWDQEVADPEPPWELGTVSSPPDLSYPGRGNAPFNDLYGRGELVEDVRTIRSPSLATPPDWDGYRPSTLARLVVDVYDMHARESWPSAPAVDGGPDVAFVDVALDAAGRQPRRDERLAEAAGGPSARFGDAIALDVRAFDGAGDGAPRRPALPLTLGAPAPAVTGTLELAWRALAAPGEDLQMFLHVQPADGSPPVTLDGPPSRNARYPTSRWRAGDRIPTRIAWTWPTPVRSGDRLTVLVGLYRLSPGTPRLPAVDARGDRYPDDAANVAEITVR